MAKALMFSGPRFFCAKHLYVSNANEAGFLHRDAAAYLGVVLRGAGSAAQGDNRYVAGRHPADIQCQRRADFSRREMGCLHSRDSSRQRNVEHAVVGPRQPKPGDRTHEHSTANQPTPPDDELVNGPNHIRATARSGLECLKPTLVTGRFDDRLY